MIKKYSNFFNLSDIKGNNSMHLKKKNGSI